MGWGEMGQEGKEWGEATTPGRADSWIVGRETGERHYNMLQQL